MATFKYYKVPLGYGYKMIRLNRLSNYALHRITVADFNTHETGIIRDMKTSLKEIIRQAYEILEKRKVVFPKETNVRQVIMAKSRWEKISKFIPKFLKRGKR